MSKANAKTMVSDADVLTLEQQVAAQKQAKELECGKKINELLKEYGCMLSPVATIEGGRIMQIVKVVAV